MEGKLTKGQEMVGLTFNPSNDATVDMIKTVYAQLIDKLIQVRDDSASSEVKRLCSIAITEAQTAQMWAVKAVTYKF
jgi:hypothetical protein